MKTHRMLLLLPPAGLREKSPGETHRELAGLSAGCLCRVRPPTAHTRPRDTRCPCHRLQAACWEVLLSGNQAHQPTQPQAAQLCTTSHLQLRGAGSRSRLPGGQDPGGWGLGATFVKQHQDSFYSSKRLSIPVCSRPRCLLICVQEAW